MTIATSYTPMQYAVAVWLLLALVLIVLHAVVDLSRLFTRLSERTPSVDVDVDVQAVIAESMHIHTDPLAPDHQYAATNEARQRIRRRR